MVRRAVAVAVIAAMITAMVAATPRRAAATDNLVYIIPAAVGGVVIVAVLIAIIMTNRSKDSDMELVSASDRRDENPRLRVGPACRRPNGEMPLLCW